MVWLRIELAAQWGHRLQAHRIQALKWESISFAFACLQP